MTGTLGALVLAGWPGLVACGSSSGSRRGATSGGAALRPVELDAAREYVSVSAVTDLSQVVAGMNAFSDRLYRDAATTTANWTISPLSIEVAFAMLRAGARTTSASELDRVFGFPRVAAPQGSPHAALNALTAKLTTNQPVPTKPPSSSPSGTAGSTMPAPIVAIANGLFLDRSFAPEVEHAFLSLLASQYGAAPTMVDFAATGAVAQINAWVTTQTHGRITHLFDNLDAGVKLVLANAVYLKANWASPFEAARTANGSFTLPSGRQVTGRLMRQTYEGVRYSAAADWQRVSLPYATSDLAMRVVVPRAATFRASTLAGALAAATASTARDKYAHVDLTLPRWNTSTALDLRTALTALGLKDLFEPDADLSGIARGLSVSDAVHRANITVNELGTEAAAVTGIGIATSAMSGAPIPVVADRPFAWAIVHEPTGTPLFTGHVVNPLL